MIVIAVVEERCQLFRALSRGLCRAETVVVSRRSQLAVPTGTGQKGSRGVDDAVAPMNAEHSLAAEILRPFHVRLKAAGAKLRKPHGRIILDPGNRPTLTAAQLAESLVDRVPAERVAQCRENNVFRQPLMQGLEMASYPAPSCQHQPLAGCMLFEKITGLNKGRNRERHIPGAALPVSVFVLPEPDIIDHGIALQKVGQPALQKIPGRP